MNTRSVSHATFVIERTYSQPPAKVFAAFANPASKAKWFVGPDNWDKSNHKLDFRVGGKESVSGGPPGGPLHSYDATIQDIVEDARIVTTYEMRMDDARTSISVGTTEFRPSGTGTTLVYTEQGVFLDGYDNARERERGTQELFNNLESFLKR